MSESAQPAGNVRESSEDADLRAALAAPHVTAAWQGVTKPFRSKTKAARAKAAKPTPAEPVVAIKRKGKGRGKGKAKAAKRVVPDNREDHINFIKQI